MQKWYITKPVPKKNIKGGYRVCNIIGNDGNSYMASRHRLMCMTFKPIDDSRGMVVNHIDGIPGNDDIDNLEWLTYSGNTQHAYDLGLYPNKVKAVLVWDLNLNAVTRFESLAKCYRHLGKDENFIRRRLRAVNSARRFKDNLRFKYDDGTDWVELEPLYANAPRNGVYVMGRDVHTGLVDLYENITAAAYLNGVHQASVSNHIARESFSPLAGKVFRIAGEDIVWPKYTEHQLELYRRHPTNAPRGVLVTWIESGNTKLYTSVEDASEGLDKHSLVISRLCASGNVHFRDKFKCSYVYPDRNMLTL